MKKLFILITFIIMSLGVNAQGHFEGGLVMQGNEIEFGNSNSNLFINKKDAKNTQNTNNVPENNAPIGTGLGLLIGFGAAYEMYKRGKK